MSEKVTNDQFHAQLAKVLGERDAALTALNFTRGERNRAEKDAARAYRLRDAAIDERNRTAVELVKLTAELVKLTAERDELTAERDELTAERDELTAERDELRVELNKTEFDAEQSDAAFKAVRGERNELRAERDKLLSERIELRAEHEETLRWLRAQIHEISVTSD